MSTLFRIVVCLMLPCSAIATDYSYDSIGRLTKVTYQDDTTITYQYDKAGNLLSSTSDTGVEFYPDTFIAPRTTAYQTPDAQTIIIDLFENGQGYAFNSTSTVYDVTLTGLNGFTLDPDYQNNGRLSFSPDPDFSGVITLNYQILENGIVYNVTRYITIREMDSDRDGIPDAWEEAGSINGVSLVGAEVGVKDLFLWIDHMYKPCSAWSCAGSIDYKLTQQLAPIYRAFANQGINLHVKHGTTSHRVEYIEDLELGDNGIDCTSEDAATAMRCGLAHVKRQGFWLIDGQANIDKSREKVYHYLLIGDKYNGSTSSGIAFRDSNLIFVARSQTPDDTSLSGTIMHEFGHALGLGHGGPISGNYGSDALVETENGVEIANYNINYKPNYLSIMNYHFQMSGLRTLNSDGEFENGLIDFASASLSTIDEADLPSALSCLSPDIACVENDIMNRYGSKYIRSSDTGGILPELCLNYGWGRCPANLDDLLMIDWATDGTNSADINWKKSGDTDYERAANGKGITRLVSQADWSNLDFTLGYIGDPDQALSISAGLSSASDSFVSEPPAEEIVFPVNFRLELLPVRQLITFKPGDSRSALGYQLSNTGTLTDTYTISYEVHTDNSSSSLPSDWQVRGPSAVELAEGETTYLDIQVTAPTFVTHADEAEIMITVHSQGSPNNSQQKFGIVRITEDFFDDSDGDGIPDEVELELGTDPFNADSDNDGLNDSQDPEPNTPNSVASPVEPESWVEITDLVRVHKTTGIFNRTLRKITSIATITNTSGQNLNGELRLELVSSNLALETESDGQLENGNHYWNLTLGSETFSIDDERSKQINFALSRARLTYEVRVHFKSETN